MPAQAWWVRKVDAQTGHGLSGARFRLRGSDNSLQFACSDDEGRLCFNVRPGMRYVLVEMSAPAGYERETHAFEVVVDANGGVWVDGQRAETLEIPNILELPGP